VNSIAELAERDGSRVALALAHLAQLGATAHLVVDALRVEDVLGHERRPVVEAGKELLEHARSPDVDRDVVDPAAVVVALLAPDDDELLEGACVIRQEDVVVGGRDVEASGDEQERGSEHERDARPGEAS
jgi:hypothetical protein